MQWTDRIGRRVKLRDIHVFLAVAQAGSMAKAADQLAISQPVISKTIADLEHALGVRLLDRSFQGVEPTAYGRAFITCGSAVFDQMRRGVQEIEFLADPTAGELWVGCITPLMEDLIPKVVERFSARYPRIVCHAWDGQSPAMNQLLRERKLDFAVSRAFGTHLGDEFTAEFLFAETMLVVAGLDNPWAHRRKIDFTDLLGEPWTLPPSDNLISLLISEGFHNAGVALPPPRVVSGSVAARTRLVEGGRFLTLLPASMLHFGADHMRVKALPVTLPLAPLTVDIVSLRDRTPNPIAKLFIDELRAVVELMTKQHPNMFSNSIDGGRPASPRRRAQSKRLRSAARSDNDRSQNSSSKRPKP